MNFIPSAWSWTALINCFVNPFCTLMKNTKFFLFLSFSAVAWYLWLSLELFALVWSTLMIMNGCALKLMHPSCCHAGYDAQVSALTSFIADRPACGVEKSNMEETRREILNMGISGCVQVALEESSVEDENTGELEQAINTPDSRRWPDIDAAKVRVRITSSGPQRGNMGLYLNPGSWVWK